MTFRPTVDGRTPRASTATHIPGISNQTDVALAFGFGRCVTLKRSERPPGLLSSIADELHARGLYDTTLALFGEDMNAAVQFAVSEDAGRARGWRRGGSPERSADRINGAGNRVTPRPLP